MGVKQRIKAFVGSLTKQRIRVYNTVAVRNRSLLDIDDHYPDDKANLVDTTLEYINPDDRVVLVGGGKGTVPTHVARTGAKTVVYEAAKEQIELLEETQELNGVGFELHHAVVGNEGEIYGQATNAVHQNPDELSGDVLVLDCEGAETFILPRPEFETVIVETHPEFGASTEQVQTLLSGESSVVAPDPIDGDVIVR